MSNGIIYPNSGLCKKSNILYRHNFRAPLKILAKLKGKKMKSHEVDYEIMGDDLQVIEVELDSGETVIAKAGKMACIYVTRGEYHG